jgi:hypothetical protein
MTAGVANISREIARRGYVALETSMQEFEELSLGLGEPICVRPGGPTLETLKPLNRESASPRSLSAAHGLGTFPFHTDAAHHRSPPRYLALRLADHCCGVTPTLVIDADPQRFSAAERMTLRRETWLVQGGFNRTFYAPILDQRGTILRFDPGCMVEPAGTQLVGHEILAQRFETAAAVSWKPGTTLFVDNWRVLHARPAVVRGDESRTLVRMLLA